MQRIYVLWILLALYCGARAESLQEPHIVVVIASYNNRAWYLRNILSVLEQTYPHYHIIYIDDASCDGTAQAVARLITHLGAQDKITLLENKTRKGALENQYYAIHACDDRALMVMLDGDDRLLDKHVLEYIATYYKEHHDIWLTYGQYIEYPSNKLGICCAYPLSIIERNLFRKYTYVASHLRTFYAGLFKRIAQADLCDDQGNFFTATGDMAAMIPMLEMANGHFAFIAKPLYEYNIQNPLNDYKVALQKQHEIERVIRARQPYKKLASLW